ncbi:MAG: ABC transporter ATP-binding protein [Maricaulaceae bacterium]|nr:ABC transporter ATP-binding protein [Maricaulaceae bacterium]
MPRIVVENVTLNYPLYGRLTSSQAERLTKAPDLNQSGSQRLIRNKHGGVIGVQALQNVSFTAESGERLALVGENGSGKTTLLQALAQIYAPDVGKIYINGQFTSLVNINLGMQPEASGHRNITLRGLAAGRTREEIEYKRAEIAAFSELEEFLDLPVMTYSSGMRMRLNFAIATAFEPEILILDEWLSAGDSAFRAKATARMKTFVGKAGILVFASHNRNMLLDNCQRAIWLDAGRIREDGPVKDILGAYDQEMVCRQAIRDERSRNSLAAIEAKKSLLTSNHGKKMVRASPAWRARIGALLPGRLLRRIMKILIP